MSWTEQPASSSSDCSQAEQRPDIVRAELRSPVGVVHHERPTAAELVPDRESRTDRAASIAGGGLHINSLERGHAPDLSVGDGIHGAATSQREIFQAVCPVGTLNKMKKRLFIHRLHRTRDVAMPFLKRISRPCASGLKGLPEPAQTDRRTQVNRWSIDTTH